MLDQLELQLAELEESVAEDKGSTQMKAPPATARTRQAAPRARSPPAPRHLPRERVVHPAPSACPGCGGALEEAGRGRHRDAGARAGAVEGDPARAREVLLPQMRGHHAGASAFASDRTRPRRTAAAWPRSCSPSIGRTCRSTGRATSMPTKASISTPRRWPTGSAPVPRR